MKNKLPEKIEAPTITTSSPLGSIQTGTRSYQGYLSVEDQKINQLIDYIAELTEVVEGKQKFDVEKWYRGEPQNTTTPTQPHQENITLLTNEIEALREDANRHQAELAEVYQEINEDIFSKRLNGWSGDLRGLQADIKALALTRGIDISDKK